MIIRNIFIKNLLIFMLLLFIEIIIALYFEGGLIRTFFGDVFVVLLVFYFVRIFYSKNILLVIFFVFTFACGIEFLQYLDIVNYLKIDNKIIRIVIGSVFDWKDIGAYVLGGIILLVIHCKQWIQNLK